VIPCRNLENCFNSTLTRLALEPTLPTTKWGKDSIPRGIMVVA
jgi:hypothetical protein